MSNPSPSTTPSPAVLAALAAAEARQGNLHFARLALGRADPLRRGGLLRRVRRAMEEAEARLGGGVFGPESQAHLARVAYLLEAEVEVTQDELADVEAVRARFAAEKGKHPAEVPRGFPLTMSLVACVLAVLAGAALIWFVTREKTPSLEGARRTPPGPAGAYAKGGKPARTGATLDEIFGEALPKHFIAAADLARARAEEAGDRVLASYTRRLEKARAAVLAKAHLRALGEHPAKRLADVLSAIQNAALAGTTSMDDATAKAFFAAIELLNRELAAGDFGYHVVGDLLVRGKHRFVLLASYGVEEVVRYAVAGKPVTVLRLDRLDQTNWAPNRLGAHRPEQLAPFTEMSTVRRDLVTYVVPELVTEGGLTYDGKRLSNEVVQAEHRALLGDKVADLVALGRFLGKRIRVLRSIQRHPQTKLSFLIPDTTKRDRELLALFRKDFNAPVALANQLETILGDIDVPAYRGLVDRVARLHALPTEAFVLQLWWDDLRRAEGARKKAKEGRKGTTDASAVSLPKPLREHLAGLLKSGKHNQLVARVARGQVSGQLASLAHPHPLTRTVLTKLSGHLFDPDVWHTPRYYATVVIFKELAARLGVPQGADLKTDGDPDRQAASHVYAALVAKPPAEVQKAARATWEHLFGGKMPAITGGPIK